MRTLALVLLDGDAVVPPAFAAPLLLVTGCLGLIPLTVVVLTIGHGAPWWGPALDAVVLVVALRLITNPALT